MSTALISQHRTREELLHLQRALSLSPDPQTRLDFAALLYQTGHLRRAAEQLRRVVALEPEWPVALNNLAWLLATRSDAEVRDGKEAVRCAERACRLTSFKQTMMVGTLAASCAEAGRFPEAVATAETDARMGTASGETRFAAVNEQLARLYRENKPWREPHPSGQGPQEHLP
jgi:predicted Zn-dependent protease